MPDPITDLIARVRQRVADGQKLARADVEALLRIADATPDLVMPLRLGRKPGNQTIYAATAHGGEALVAIAVTPQAARWLVNAANGHQEES